jgi:hypothetical protein
MFFPPVLLLHAGQYVRADWMCTYRTLTAYCNVPKPSGTCMYDQDIMQTAPLDVLWLMTAVQPAGWTDWLSYMTREERRRERAS